MKLLETLLLKIEQKEHKSFNHVFNTFLLISLLVFSFLNTITLMISLFLLTFLLTKKELGALTVIIFIMIRTIINPGVAIDISSVQIFKYFLLLLSSFSIIYLNMRKKNSYNNLPVYSLTLFYIYIVLSSLLTSDFPIVSIFKITLFYIVFLAILVGIKTTSNEIDWKGKMFQILFFLTLISIPLTMFPLGYLRNGVSFQGITNQPNMFGIILTFYVAFNLVRSNSKKDLFYSKCAHSLIGLSLIYITFSRTALITVLSCILIYYLINFTKNFKNIIFGFGLFFPFVLIIGLTEKTQEIFVNYIYKSNYDSIFYSRSIQLETLLNNFLESPLIGNGFGVPSIEGLNRSWNFGFEYIVEAGNIIFGLLAFSGILGLFLFVFLIFRIIYISNNRLELMPLLFVTFMLNMGEMILFSPNNVGVLCYISLAIYAYDT